MKRIVLNTLVFLFIVFCLHTLWVYGTSSMKYSKKASIFQHITGNAVKKSGGTYFAFYEAEHLTKPLDILVIGSSRAYRALDPTVFDKANLNIQILASSSQTSVNTYFLIKKYLSVVKPKLVIFDVHLGLLNNSGLESLYDLSVNTPISVEMFEMAWSIDQINAYSNCYASLINQLDTPLYQDFNHQFPKWYYKGFTTDFKSDSTIKVEKYDTVYFDRALSAQEISNLSYIEETIKYVKSRNIKIVITRQPAFSSESQLCETKLQEIVKKQGVPYINLNKYRNSLIPARDFFDKRHLNTSGGRIISDILIKELQSSGIIR